MPAIVIPWLGGDPWRVNAYQFVRNWWQERTVHYSDWEILEGTGKTRASAKNQGANQTDWDAVVFCDADCFAPFSQIEHAARVAIETNHLVICSTELQKLTKKSSQSLYKAHNHDIPKGVSYSTHCGGIVCVSREAWNQLGGYDERFTSWGGEDRALWLASQALLGPIERVEGIMWHLWHSKANDSRKLTQEYQEMLKRSIRYKLASGLIEKAEILPETPEAKLDPDSMRAILSEPGGPLANSLVPPAIE